MTPLTALSEHLCLMHLLLQFLCLDTSCVEKSQDSDSHLFNAYSLVR